MKCRSMAITGRRSPCLCQSLCWGLVERASSVPCPRSLEDGCVLANSSAAYSAGGGSAGQDLLWSCRSSGFDECIYYRFPCPSRYRAWWMLSFFEQHMNSYPMITCWSEYLSCSLILNPARVATCSCYSCCGKVCITMKQRVDKCRSVWSLRRQVSATRSAAYLSLHIKHISKLSIAEAKSLWDVTLWTVILLGFQLRIKCWVGSKLTNLLSYFEGMPESRTLVTVVITYAESLKTARHGNLYLFDQRLVLFQVASICLPFCGREAPVLSLDQMSDLNTWHALKS